MTFSDDTERDLHDAYLAIDSAAARIDDDGLGRLLDLAARIVNDVREAYRDDLE